MKHVSIYKEKLITNDIFPEYPSNCMRYFRIIPQIHSGHNNAFKHNSNLFHKLYTMHMHAQRSLPLISHFKSFTQFNKSAEK